MRIIQMLKQKILVADQIMRLGVGYLLGINS